MKIFGIIGNPVEHSLSPVMHNAAFKYLNIDAVYFKFKVDLRRLKDAILGADSLGFGGLNVTVPFKEEAIKYTTPDTLAEEIGAINTIKFGRTVEGFNTDAVGAVMALKEVTDIKDSNVLILGAGGAARAVAYALSSHSEKVFIANRTFKKGFDLAKKVGGEPIKLDEIPNIIKSVDIVINTTTVGLNEDRSLLYHKDLHKDMVVFDLVYSPVKTRLLREAEIAGAKTLNGIKMLLYQGAASFEVWTGIKAPLDLMEEAIYHEIS